LKEKDLMMVPARVAIALVDDGWYLRSDIIWAKKNCMPESVTDRPTSAHEHIFLLTKKAKYFYDSDAVRESYAPATFQRLNQATFDQQQGGPKDDQNGNRSPRRALVNLKNNIPPAPQLEDSPENHNPAGRNQRNVWHLATEPFPEAHFATFPTELPRRCIKAGTSERGACAACGAPWRRTVERDFYGSLDPVRDIAKGRQTPIGQKLWDAYEPPKTTGWQPGCSCDAEVVPCVVLDIFAGSGTTGLVADQLGRDAILIELNPDYAAMARERITGDAPMFARVVAD
jgi:DNA modification methylase